MLIFLARPKFWLGRFKFWISFFLSLLALGYVFLIFLFWGGWCPRRDLTLV
jgi:hypothetical protein